MPSHRFRHESCRVRVVVNQKLCGQDLAVGGGHNYLRFRARYSLDFDLRIMADCRQFDARSRNRDSGLRVARTDFAIEWRPGNGLAVKSDAQGVSGGFCRFEIHLESCVAFALHEIWNVPSGNCDDNLQVSGTSLGGVDAERDRFSDGAVGYVCYCHSVCIVSFHEERTSFYVTSGKSYLDTVVTDIQRSEGNCELIWRPRLWCDLE